MFYSQQEFHSEQAIEFSLPYQCPACNLQCTAVVTGLGEGQTFAPYGFGAEGAEDHAQGKAATAAASNAERVLELAACPSCGERQGTLRPYVAQATMLGLAVFLLLAAGAFVLRFIIAGALPLVLLLAGYVALRVSWSRVLFWVWDPDERVTFGDPDAGVPQQSFTPGPSAFKLDPEARRRLAEKRAKRTTGVQDESPP